jgi:hypothetical protein
MANVVKSLVASLMLAGSSMAGEVSTNRPAGTSVWPKAEPISIDTGIRGSPGFGLTNYYTKITFYTPFANWEDGFEYKIYGARTMLEPRTNLVGSVLVYVRDPFLPEAEGLVNHGAVAPTNYVYEIRYDNSQTSDPLNSPTPVRKND